MDRRSFLQSGPLAAAAGAALANAVVTPAEAAESRGSTRLTGWRNGWKASRCAAKRWFIQTSGNIVKQAIA